MLPTSNTFLQFIKEKIHHDAKPIAFSTFMQLALYHPQFGFYCRPEVIIGAEGHFTTAPQITPLFAFCISHFIKNVFVQGKLNAVLEIGAGTGRFAFDLLTKLNDSKKLPSQYFIYEISPALQMKQQTLLKSLDSAINSRISWLDSLPQEFEGVIFANEVLDALPVDCFCVDKGVALERAVGWSNQQLIWQNRMFETKQLARKTQNLVQKYKLSDGYHSEISLPVTQFVTQLAASLKRGIILLIDYGYDEREYYHPARFQGTLSSFHRHRQLPEILLCPGERDITAHVNFTAVIAAAHQEGCELAGYTTQAKFLLELGLLNIAGLQGEKCGTASALFNLHQSIKTLTMPQEMGQVVKAMALVKHYPHEPLGFSQGDESQRL